MALSVAMLKAALAVEGWLSDIPEPKPPKLYPFALLAMISGACSSGYT